MDRHNYRDRDNRNRQERSRYSSNRVDEDSYRGAYRLDNSSDHRNVSTWDGYGSTERRGNDYNRNYNQNYNRDYNNSQRRDYGRGYDHDNYNLNSRHRDEDRGYRSSNYADWNDREHYNRQNQGQQHRSVHDRIEDQDPYGFGNFSADYGPDRYGQGGGENYGNEAGSLSYGYDGSSNYDPDWNSTYDPLSGERRSYHGNYISRHPERGQYRNNASRRASDHNRGDRY